MARSKYKPTRFMLPTSHYDKERADHAVNFIQSLKHTKGKAHVKIGFWQIRMNIIRIGHCR